MKAGAGSSIQKSEARSQESVISDWRLGFGLEIASALSCLAMTKRRGLARTRESSLATATKEEDSQ